MTNLQSVAQQAELTWTNILGWLASPQFYAQISFIAVTVIAAYVLSGIIRKRVKVSSTLPLSGVLAEMAEQALKLRDVLFPILVSMLLSVAVEVARNTMGSGEIVQLALSISVVFLIYRLVKLYVENRGIVLMVTWVGIPVALLSIVGWLDDITLFLDSYSVEVGNIKLTLYVIARTIFFGTILFWLGRISNSTGKRVINSQPNLDLRTREILSKLFEIFLFVAIFLLLLQIMGINLTALAVFGGALGVGLGFGLQNIASNFISGIIILLDKSITIGDYIELEDGRTGVLREMTMRSATLETYDGKDIMVPNETFITSSFTNWTHNNAKQRYPLEFSVAYKTDLPLLFDIVRKVVASHPQVLSGDNVPVEEQPDAEIASFGDSGINILVEFWMEGIDDGPNRVGADLLLMIWMELKRHDIEIPFPQREVSILESPKGS